MKRRHQNLSKASTYRVTAKGSKTYIKGSRYGAGTLLKLSPIQARNHLMNGLIVEDKGQEKTEETKAVTPTDSPATTKKRSPRKSKQ